MPDPQILTICRKAYPGANRNLVNLSTTTGLTKHVALAGTDPQGHELQFLSWYIQEVKPVLVIFGAWDPVYRAIIDSQAQGSIRFGAYWTSSGGQTDISQEMPKLVEIFQHPAVTYQLFSSDEVARGFQAAGHNAVYIPHTFPEQEVDVAESPPGSPFTISLFYSPPESRRKNVFNSLLALAGLQGDYRLLLNGLSQDPAYGTILETLRLPFHDLGWMSRDEYEKQLLGLDLGLQLSFAESFNYVAADHFLRGVPVLVSPMVPAAGFLSADLRGWLTVPEADQPSVIRQRIQRLLDDRALARKLGLQAREELTAVNRQHIEEASAILQSLIQPA